MTSLASLGILWIDESQMYVADKELYETPLEFLSAVFKHIQKLLDDWDESECGWCKLPNWYKSLPMVTTFYMVHRVNSQWHEAPFWEMIEESGQGHRSVWLIDFGTYGRVG